jgi:hypothetical protein
VGREKRARGLQRIEESETKVSLSPPNPSSTSPLLSRLRLARERRGGGRRRNPRIRGRPGGPATSAAPSVPGGASRAPGRADRAPGGLPPPPPCRRSAASSSSSSSSSSTRRSSRRPCTSASSPLPPSFPLSGLVRWLPARARLVGGWDRSGSSAL